jgi:hypothetical protein
MSPTFARRRRAQLLAELRELDRLEALTQPQARRPECGAPSPGRSTEADPSRPRETINILGAAWEVQCG